MPQSIVGKYRIPSGNRSVHYNVNLVLVKLKALLRFSWAGFIMCLCVALLLSQRALPPVHCTPLWLSACLPSHLALSTSVGKSFTSLCLNRLSNLPLDCELHERHLSIVTLSALHHAWSKTSAQWMPSKLVSGLVPCEANGTRTVVVQESGKHH